MKAKYSGIRAWTLRYSNTAAEFHLKVNIKISNIDSYASQRAHAGARWRAPVRTQAHPHAHALSRMRVDGVRNINICPWLLAPVAIKSATPVIINLDK